VLKYSGVWLKMQSPVAISSLARDAPVGRFRSIFEPVLRIGICVVLGFGPLAFGAVQPWSICILEVAVSLLFLIWAARGLIDRTYRIASNPLLLPTALFAALVLAQLTLNLSAYWYATWTKALLWASYAGLLFLASQTFQWRSALKAFSYFCVGYGFLISLFAIVQYFTSNGKIYWVIVPRNGGWIFGPYVNHAHYAGLIEMLVPFPIMLAVAGNSERSGRAFFLFTAVVMSSTIFLSESLGGMIAFAVELAFLGLILFHDRRFAYRELILLGILCVCLIAWLVWLRPPGLIERLARLFNPIRDAGATGRVAIVKDSFRMLHQRPFLGWGLGTFPVVYPSFRSFFTNQWVNEAHNDFVQTLVECGILGFAIATVFIGLLFREGIRNLRYRRDDARTAAVLAAFLGCIGLLTHGLVDFNLQIPANAAFFFTLSAIATTSLDTLHVTH
jgi:O-antigen ligase